MAGGDRKRICVGEHWNFDRRDTCLSDYSAASLALFPPPPFPRFIFPRAGSVFAPTPFALRASNSLKNWPV